VLVSVWSPQLQSMVIGAPCLNARSRHGVTAWNASKTAVSLLLGMTNTAGGPGLERGVRNANEDT